MSFLLLIVGAILVSLAVAKLFPDLTFSKHVTVIWRSVWPKITGVFGKVAGWVSSKTDDTKK